MRILRIVNSATPKLGGPIEVIKQVSAFLSTQGHETEVVSLDSPEDEWIAGFPMTIHPLGPAATAYRHSKQFVPWMDQNADRFDLVIIHGIWLFSTFGAWQSLRKLGKPYYLYTHGSLDPWYKRAYPLKHLKKSVYWMWREHRVLRDARAVLFTSEEERLLARQSFWPYRCNEMVVSYGTMKPMGEPDAQREAFFAKFPELRAKRLVLFMGRIQAKKGCDILIEAFARAAGDSDALHLVIAGPDETGWQAELQARVQQLKLESRVTWTGMVMGDLKWGAFHAAEIFMLPSRGENFGVAVAEALACGVPVLVSNKVNIWRELQASGAGLVADDTPDGIGQILRQWLALSAEQQQAMRHFAEVAFRERFDLSNSAQQLVDLLTSS